MPRERMTLSARWAGLGRLATPLVVVLALAGFWHLVYGASLITSAAVVAEVSALIVLAVVCAWRWSR
jgi:hypothetical protein